MATLNLNCPRESQNFSQVFKYKFQIWISFFGDIPPGALSLPDPIWWLFSQLLPRWHSGMSHHHHPGGFLHLSLGSLFPASQVFLCLGSSLWLESTSSSSSMGSKNFENWSVWKMCPSHFCITIYDFGSPLPFITLFHPHCSFIKSHHPILPPGSSQDIWESCACCHLCELHRSTQIVGAQHTRANSKGEFNKLIKQGPDNKHIVCIFYRTVSNVRVCD